MTQDRELHNTEKLDIPSFALLSLLTICGFTSITLGFLLCPFVLIICCKRINNSKSFHLQLLDCSLLIICVIEIFLLFFSSYIPNSINSVLNVLFGVCFWFLLRVCINKSTFNSYLKVLSVIILLLSFGTLLFYAKHRSGFIQAGYEDMTLVRQYYHPFGIISNDWVAVLICLLPIPMHSYLNSERLYQKTTHLVSFTALNLALLVSFSRGAYLSLFIYYGLCSLFYFTKGTSRKKRFIRLFICTVAISSIALLPDKASLTTTLSATSTTSQKRSITGRYKKWGEAIALFKENLVYGTGGGNYGKSSDLFVKQDGLSLSNRSTNSYLQLIVEKGLVGASAYLFSIICILIMGFKYRSRLFNSIPFIASLVAFSVREFFFSSLFIEKHLPLLLAVSLYVVFCEFVDYETETKKSMLPVRSS